MLTPLSLVPSGVSAVGALGGVGIFIILVFFGNAVWTFSVMPAASKSFCIVLNCNTISGIISCAFLMLSNAGTSFFFSAGVLLLKSALLKYLSMS